MRQERQPGKDIFRYMEIILAIINILFMFMCRYFSTPQWLLTTFSVCLFVSKSVTNSLMPALPITAVLLDLIIFSSQYFHIYVNSKNVIKRHLIKNLKKGI